MKNIQMGNQRDVAFDLCKVIAMFLVTWGHCSQCLSGICFPELFGMKGAFIPIHMPLFMIISGYFINVKTIKDNNILSYIHNKFNRLMIPCIIWYLLYCIAMMQMPNLKEVIDFYWFLSCLFFNLIIIAIAVKYTNSLSLSLIIVYLLVLIFPMSDFDKINYMQPFLIIGMMLRFWLTKNNKMYSYALSILCILCCVILYTMWRLCYSIYITPFSILDVNKDMLISYVFRILIGASGGIGIILLIKILRNKILRSSLLINISKTGKYTLCIYTMSFIINGVVGRFYRHFSINDTANLEFYSFLMCVAVYYISYRFSKIFDKFQMTRKYLLGNDNSSSKII